MQRLPFSLLFFNLSETAVEVPNAKQRVSKVIFITVRDKVGNENERRWRRSGNKRQ